MSFIDILFIIQSQRAAADIGNSHSRTRICPSILWLPPQQPLRSLSPYAVTYPGCAKGLPSSAVPVSQSVWVFEHHRLDVSALDFRLNNIYIQRKNGTNYLCFFSENNNSPRTSWIHILMLVRYASAVSWNWTPPKFKFFKDGDTKTFTHAVERVQTWSLRVKQYLICFSNQVQYVSNMFFCADVIKK